MPIPEFVVELRRMIGHAELWLPGVTAVVSRGDDVLLVERTDNGEWSPVTGCVDPGEQPAIAAAREALEETGVVVRVDRLASVGVTGPITYPNGDRGRYLDLTFACTWLRGEAVIGDDESTDVRWWPAQALPPMDPLLVERIEAARSREVAARFEV